MEKKKYIIAIIVVILLVGISITFAFFMVQYGPSSNANVNVNTSSVDDLKFEVSKELSISANQFNFADGSGDLSDSSIAKAMLKANDSTNTATYNYNVYFNITNNSYIYTTSDSKAEIVLSITDPSGNSVTSVSGLNYVSVTNASGEVIKGFDITTKTGLINIASNYEIIANSSSKYTNQEWTFKVTFVNLNSDQSGNSEKTMNGKIIIQKDKLS